MAEAGSERTVGFLDLVETMPPASADASGRDHIQRRIDALADAVRAAAGVVIKQIGDELMCAFPGPADAVRTTVELQNLMYGWELDGARVSLRLGLHHGPVVEEAGDLFGDTVNVAARLTSIATAGQIITTDEVVAGLDVAQRATVKPFDELRVRGSARRRRIHRVLWAPRAETPTATRRCRRCAPGRTRAP